MLIVLTAEAMAIVVHYGALRLAGLACSKFCAGTHAPFYLRDQLRKVSELRSANVEDTLSDYSVQVYTVSTTRNDKLRATSIVCCWCRRCTISTSIASSLIDSTRVQTVFSWTLSSNWLN